MATLDSEDARRTFDETGCDGVMMAGAARQSWIFKQVHVYLSAGVVLGC